MRAQTVGVKALIRKRRLADGWPIGRHDQQAAAFRDLNLSGIFLVRAAIENGDDSIRPGGLRVPEFDGFIEAGKHEVRNRRQGLAHGYLPSIGIAEWAGNGRRIGEPRASVVWTRADIAAEAVNIRDFHRSRG